jgi:hypothetical protein
MIDLSTLLIEMNGESSWHRSDFHGVDFFETHSRQAERQP